MKRSIRVFAFVLLFASLSSVGQTHPYQYFRLGSSKDVTVPFKFGAALMGGGEDLDDAFRWLCTNGDGGDFLILRAHGDDEYNSYVNGLCKANSVATLVMPTRESALDPSAAEIIRHAEAIFIAGGDQANYTRNWKGTPVEEALNANIAAGKPIGGTSAGLAVLGQFIYSAEGDAPDDDDLASPQVLSNPFSPRVALRRDFLNIALLRNTLTDTHFAKRDRLGRSLGFLARIVHDGWSAHPREIAVDEKNAVLVEADGKGRVVGSGKGAYFFSVSKAPEVCRPDTPLTFRQIMVYHGPPGSQFDLRKWRGAGGTKYSLSVDAGQIHSSQPGGQPY
jgi:cyanophycinase